MIGGREYFVLIQLRFFLIIDSVFVIIVVVIFLSGGVLTSVKEKLKRIYVGD